VLEFIVFLSREEKLQKLFPRIQTKFENLTPISIGHVSLAILGQKLQMSNYLKMVIAMGN